MQVLATDFCPRAEAFRAAMGISVAKVLMTNPEMASNSEWKEWGKLDPLWGVASWPGCERGGVTQWTDEENRKAVGGIEARQKLQGSAGNDTDNKCQALMEILGWCPYRRLRDSLADAAAKTSK